MLVSVGSLNSRHCRFCLNSKKSSEGTQKKDRNRSSFCVPLKHFYEGLFDLKKQCQYKKVGKELSELSMD